MGSKTIRERLAKLINVKSLVTLALTATFIYLAIVKVIAGDKFYDIFLMIMSFYFGTQSSKKDEQ